MTTTDDTMTMNVAVLGLGAMGTRITARLLEAGHWVRVWNRTAERAEALRPAGARPAATPADAVQGADVVLVMVRDDRASREVWLGEDGAADALEPDAVAIDASTITPDHARALAEAFAERDRAFLECPVVGSRPQADAGQLVGLVGGDPEVLARVEPVLTSLLGRAVHLGPHGSAAVAKLAVNAFFAAQVAAAGEVVSFLRDQGIEDERWQPLLEGLPITAPPIAAAIAGMAAGAFAPAFPIELVEKDLRYFEAAADAAGTEHPVVHTTRSLYSRAIAAGHGGQNIHGVVQVYGAD